MCPGRLEAQNALGRGGRGRVGGGRRLGCEAADHLAGACGEEVGGAYRRLSLQKKRQVAR